jgi:hypothetical protein
MQASDRVLRIDNLYAYIGQYSPEEMITPSKKELIKPAETLVHSLENSIKTAFNEVFTQVFDNKKEFLTKGIKQIQEFYVLKEKCVSLKILQKYSDEPIIEWVQKCILQSNVSLRDLQYYQVDRGHNPYILNLIAAAFLKMQLQGRTEAFFQGVGRVRQVNAMTMEINCEDRRQPYLQLIIGALNLLPTISKVVILNGNLKDSEYSSLIDLSQKGKKIIRGEFTLHKDIIDNVGYVAYTSFLTSVWTIICLIIIASEHFVIPVFVYVLVSFAAIFIAAAVAGVCVKATFLLHNHWTLEQGYPRYRLPWQEE